MWSELHLSCNTIILSPVSVWEIFKIVLLSKLMLAAGCLRVLRSHILRIWFAGWNTCRTTTVVMVQVKGEQGRVILTLLLIETLQTRQIVQSDLCPLLKTPPGTGSQHKNARYTYLRNPRMPNGKMANKRKPLAFLLISFHGNADEISLFQSNKVLYHQPNNCPPNIPNLSLKHLWDVLNKQFLYGGFSMRCGSGITLIWVGGRETVIMFASNFIWKKTADERCRQKQKKTVWSQRRSLFF